MAKKLKKLISDLSYIGPRRVMRGDLDDMGMPGIIYAPAGRAPSPVVVLVHDWLTPASSYKTIARHLASWGIACVVPTLERSVFPDPDNLVDQVKGALDVVSRLQLGNVTAPLDLGKIALFGHGLGASIAVLAAADIPELAAVVAAYPTETTPSAVDAAAQCKMPSLVLAPVEDAVLSVDISEELAQAWAGNMVLRSVEGASRQGLSGKSPLSTLGITQADDKSVLKLQTALIVGYLWYQLTGDKAYAGFASIEDDVAGSVGIAQSAAPFKEENRSLFHRIFG